MKSLHQVAASVCVLVAISVAMVSGCGDQIVDIEETRGALSVCNETVPPTRFIDGIPAYAQCAGSENASIYSNNGVDTSTTSGGSDWVRTQGSGGYQCTELAHRYLHFRWNITNWLPRGNAGTWCDTQPTAASGVVQTTVPVHGDLIVFAPGSCGASSSTGHVAVVDTVDMTRSQVTFVEENGANRRSSAQSCGKCFLHVVANNGTVAPPDGGTTSTGGGPGTTGTGGRAGTGGAIGTGGATSGPGGNQVLGTGGAGDGTGGALGGTGGISGGAGGAFTPDGDPPGVTVNGGFACRVSGADPTAEFLTTFLAVLGSAAFWRRRSRRSQGPPPP